jgi:hypothetical protein
MKPKSAHDSALQDASKLLTDDPDHHVIVARRDILVALALTGFASVGACGGREDSGDSPAPGAGGVVATLVGGATATVNTGGRLTGGSNTGGVATGGAIGTGGSATGGWLGTGGLDGLLGTGGANCQGCGCNATGCT